MTRRDIGWAAALAALAGGIWVRDRAWVASASQTLPILAGFGLLIVLLWPWRWESGERAGARGAFAAALLLGSIGLALDSTLLLALAWCALLWSWLSARVAASQLGLLRRLLVLPLLSFPWLANDFPRLGWSFRLSAAWATAGALSLAHVPVLREGTRLVVRDFPLSIEPACSGLSGLQALLIGGTALACLRLRRTSLFWPSLAVLPAAAWLANLARVLFAAVLAATVPRPTLERWLGPLHVTAGWIAVGAVFTACAAFFSAAERWSMRRTACPPVAVPAAIPRSPLIRAEVPRAPADSIPEGCAALAAEWFGTGRAGPSPWLEAALLGYGAWAARSIWGTWWHAPFERLGALAFALWLAPVVCAPIRRWRVRHAWLAGLGIAAVAAGQFGEFHLLCQAGLAALMVAMAPSRSPWTWGAGALAWLSALGWIGSRWGVPPAAVALIRISVACAAAAWERWGGRRVRLPLPFSYARAK